MLLIQWQRLQAMAPVQLRYDDAIVFETSTGGIDIPDDKKLQFGAGQDLQIYHDSSTMYRSLVKVELLTYT